MKFNSLFSGILSSIFWGVEGVKYVHIQVTSYHLAIDCCLQGIHKLCSDSNEIMVVCLHFVKSLQVGHGPVLRLH